MTTIELTPEQVYVLRKALIRYADATDESARESAAHGCDAHADKYASLSIIASDLFLQLHGEETKKPWESTK